jgi:hypothetical protein
MILRNNFRTAVLATALLSLLPLAASAQSSAGSASAAHRSKSTGKADAAEAMYPKATRAEPKIVETAFQDKLVKLSDQVNKKQNEEVLVGAEAILADPKRLAISSAPSAKTPCRTTPISW